MTLGPNDGTSRPPKPDQPQLQNPPSDGLWNKSFIRIGHGGASGSAPANTLKSLAAAIEIGVDMVEFDVRPCLDGLVLLHNDSLSDLSGASGLASQSSLKALRTLDAGDGERVAALQEALDLVKGKALMNIDLKAEGIEKEVVDIVRNMGAGGDVLISSLYPKSLIKVKALAPAIKTGISYPKDRGNVSSRAALQPAISATLRLVRFLLQYRVIGKMKAAAADAIMLHYSTISAGTVRRVHQAKGRVFAWTVDDLSTLRHLQSIGVDGIASNHPELFKELE